MNKKISGENPIFKKIAVTIIGKDSKKVYNKTSPYYGNSYFKLKTITEENKNRNFFVYPNELSKGKFQQITSLLPNNWYLISVKKKGRNWILQNWQNLSSHEKK